MEEHGYKTIMCSVFFLDIVEYSKKSVTEQISLKDRFNGYLSSAIRDVPIADRIVLDTGDGAALSFLGDVEDALKAALNIRESILGEDAGVDPPLLVRMGINLGPVRLVRDANGQPNIVGDGISVAQRVMGFADAAQILVSRSYYDAVSRLSPQYAGMFHYQGSRTDKHVREHEVYAIGYPGDVTTYRGTSKPALAAPGNNVLSRLSWRAKVMMRSASTWADNLVDHATHRYRGEANGRRMLVIGPMLLALFLIVMLFVNLSRHQETPAANPEMPRPGAAPGRAAVAVPHAVIAQANNNEAKPIAAPSEPNKARAKIKPKKETSARGDLGRSPAERQDAQAQEPVVKNAALAPANGATITVALNDGHDARVTVSCREGTEVFVDGERKGRIRFKPLNLTIAPGQHTVIISHTEGGIYTQDVELASGKTVYIKPNFCDQP